MRVSTVAIFNFVIMEAEPKPTPSSAAEHLRGEMRILRCRFYDTQTECQLFGLASLHALQMRLHQILVANED